MLLLEEEKYPLASDFRNPAQARQMLSYVVLINV